MPRIDLTPEGLRPNHSENGEGEIGDSQESAVSGCRGPTGRRGGPRVVGLDAASPAGVAVAMMTLGLLDSGVVDMAGGSVGFPRMTEQPCEPRPSVPAAQQASVKATRHRRATFPMCWRRELG